MFFLSLKSASHLNIVNFELVADVTCAFQLQVQSSQHSDERAHVTVVSQSKKICNVATSNFPEHAEHSDFEAEVDFTKL